MYKFLLLNFLTRSNLKFFLSNLLKSIFISIPKLNKFALSNLLRILFTRKISNGSAIKKMLI